MAIDSEDFKINLNQNLWGLVVALASLGVSEFYKLCTLFWFSVAIASIMTLSIAATTLAYTRKYWNNKKS